MIPEHAKSVLKADAEAYIKRLAGWPYAGMASTADEWARRKYLFAKEIWPKRENDCLGFNCSWAERFEQMWLEPLGTYRTRLHQAKPHEPA